MNNDDELKAATARTRALLDKLQAAEQEYRLLHDTKGGSDIRTGRAWMKLRRVGDAARAWLAAEDQGDADNA